MVMADWSELEVGPGDVSIILQAITPGWWVLRP